MKKFILKVLLFFACAAVIDLAFGGIFTYLRSHAKGGITANCEYIANIANEDIIILGSSRATHHYVPKVIEDSLGMSCYNCGEEGNGVVLAYGRLKMLTKRYKPKLVIFEMTPEFDYGTKEPNTKYLGYLRPYYDKEGIKDIFNDFDDDMSKLKMRSKMYQNTGRILVDLLDNLTYRNNQQGYSPLYGRLDTSRVNSVRKSLPEMSIDNLKLSYVEKLIKLCKEKDIPLVFMITPHFGLHDEQTDYEPEIALCRKYSVPCYNYLNYEPIAENVELFQDNSHMNDEGAVIYTQMLVKEVLNQKFE